MTISCLSQHCMEVRPLRANYCTVLYVPFGLKAQLPRVGLCSTGSAFIEEFLHTCVRMSTDNTTQFPCIKAVMALGLAMVKDMDMGGIECMHS